MCYVPSSCKSVLAIASLQQTGSFFLSLDFDNRKRKGLLTDISSVHESHVCQIGVCAAGQQGNALGGMLS
jgi:hypothetical protein